MKFSFSFISEKPKAGTGTHYARKKATLNDNSIASKITSYVDAKYYARRRAPKGFFNAYQGGSGANVTATLNEKSFEDVLLKPRAGVCCRAQDISTTVAGFKLETPIILSSVGGLRGAHRDGELAATQAAGKFGSMQFVSGLTTTPIEEIMQAATGPVFQQIYYIHSRAATAQTIARASAAGVDGLVIIMDSAAPTRGSGDTLPPDRPYMPTKVGLTETLKFLPQLWSHPAWASDLARNGFDAPAAQFAIGADGKPMSLFAAAAAIYGETPSFDDIPWIRSLWDGPLILKGIVRPDDARRAVDLGADGIVVSNHGGNMLDGTIPTLRALPAIVHAVGDHTDVLIDGGIRRGSDVVKAMAMGAKAVGIGRAYLNALIAAGQPGVLQMVKLLRGEVIDTLRYLGVNTPSQIDSTFLELPASWIGISLDEFKAATTGQESSHA